MANPYEDLPPRAFWKPAVGSRNFHDLSEVWSPRFGIGKEQRIVTFGSCFAQHIGRALKQRGYAWFNAEEAPEGLSGGHDRDFNYGIFSARTANIYTTSLLLQWTRWALGDVAPPDVQWSDNGRVIDPFRPMIEPGGFASATEMLRSRQRAIGAFADCIRHAEVFVFTLGLTESWHDAEGQFEYPMCPGTAGGDFDAARHVFRNQDYASVLRALDSAIGLMAAANARLRFILTVSPVPLIATMSGRHVMVATMESKSILRAVAGHLAATRDTVDYFPSYELISSPVMRGTFFEPNQRSVNGHGVDFVMGHFFGAMESRSIAKDIQTSKTADDVLCEEELLESLGPS